jgi:deoxyribodipyrimidine photo-lyase
MKTICWLRRDLRLHDHRPLKEATSNGRQAIVCFVYDKNILSSLAPNDRRVTFIFESLEQIDQKLKKRGSRLVTLFGDPCEEIPKLAKKLNILNVFAGEDYEPYAKKRDALVKKKLLQFGANLEIIKDHVIFSGDEIVNLSNLPYKVFTPYKNNWLKKLKSKDFEEAKPALNNLISEPELGSHGELLSLKDIGFKPEKLILKSGFTAGQTQLLSFKKNIQNYSLNRDIIPKAGTSMISPHLRFGTISIREAVRLAIATDGEGSKVWLSELIWREFYHMILDQFPYVETEAFQSKYQKIKWPGSNKHFEAWCRGETGYPIVDAAMKYFNQTGWMHNRLRMITASFLVKDLLVDWRLGEKYFAKNLLDYDLASNNGGWQWCASTGVDAQPYFRVFNPTRQAEKFDPDGEFIKANIAERASESLKTIHLPKDPIVDHQEQSHRAVMLYSKEI